MHTFICVWGVGVGGCVCARSHMHTGQGIASGLVT